MNRTTLPASAILLLQMTSLAAEPVGTAYSPIQVSSTIEDRRIVEASGLARSHLHADRLWVLNDGGSGPQLFAFGLDGKAHGSVSLRNATNTDWEDLASFEHDGKAWLLVGDTGDNEARRRHYTLYLVEEPAEPGGQKVAPLRRIRYTYPDGALDAEALAIDVASDSVYILVKRTVPARLYRVSLFASGETTQVAVMLGEIASLPQPTQADLDNALAHQSWHWQPTAMDFARDGRMAVVLTYRGAYLFGRGPAESWQDALQEPPLRLDLGGIALAEAAAFGYNDSLFITVEGKKPPLYRIDPRP